MLLVDNSEPEIGERNILVQQRMRADDDLWVVRPERRPGLGSARVPRADFGVAPKQAFLAALVILRPDPRIILILLCHSRIPWISKNVMELLLEIAIRSHITIKSFAFPNCPLLFVDLVNFVSRKRFYRVDQLAQRPECCVSRVITFFRPWLDKKMHMIRHHARREQFVAFVMKMSERVENDGARDW